MSTQAQVALLPVSKSNRSKLKPTPKALFDTGKELVGLAGLPHATQVLHQLTDVVRTKITTGALKAATVTTRWGWLKIAGLCLKTAAAASLIAKIAVGLTLGVLADRKSVV